MFDFPVAIPGTTANDNAAAGQVGEYITANVAAGSAIGMTTATAMNIITISLTAGDWDVSGNVGFTVSISATTLQAWVSGVSLAPQTPDPTGANSVSSASGLASSRLATGALRLSLAATTIVYLGAYAVFGSGTVAAYGVIRARRMR